MGRVVTVVSSARSCVVFRAQDWVSWKQTEGTFVDLVDSESM